MLKNTSFKIMVSLLVLLASVTFAQWDVNRSNFGIGAGYGGGGLLRELFGGGRKSRDYRLVRDGVSFNVPDIAGSGFGQNAAFIGWVVDDYDGDRS